ncbi:MAG: mechanosensitive ion channel [Oscillospiraceae bacterium]|nr:mechanosensitive ion channel [Oscillospiraceae bacterium]
MNILNLISTAAATAEASTREAATIKDAVDELVQNPEETASKIGEFFHNMLQSILRSIPTIILAVVVLILGMIVCKLVLKVLGKGLDRTKLDLTVNNFVKQCCKIVLYVLLLTIVLSVLGIPATSIVTVIGTAGVAIGLALQSSLSNVAGGIMLLINKPFKIGDYILVSGVSGVVKQITILYTRLDSDSNQAIFIPNGQVSGAVVTNNNTNGTRRVDMKFSISYSDDYQKAREVILQVLSRNDRILTDPAPTVRMLEHAASSVNIAVRPWCKAADYWEVFFSVTEEVRAAFIESGISIPFDQLDVHVVKE